MEVRMNGRARLYLMLLAAGLLAAVLLTFQPYSADWPGTDYAGPARRYIRAAIRQDSTQLLSLSASVSPVRWALGAAREHPDTLALWGRVVGAWTGERWGDTVEVFVFPPGEECSDAPIVLRFVGAGNQARVARASSECLGLR
jgi:hypothetical protein